MQAVIFALATFFSTYLGGIFAARFKEKLNKVMAFAAGVILGVVAFDIFPEIIEQISLHDFSATEVMVALVVGFLLFHTLEKTILIQHCHSHDCENPRHHPHVGVFSALALIGHSFMDGVGIGLGFQVSEAVGVSVAIAVISHGFTDGMNTVTLMLANKNTVEKAKKFLILGALAPILGAASTLLFQVPDHFLVLYLGFFAGFLLYIGASDILPEAHNERSTWSLVGLTILGAAFIFFISQFV